MKIAEIIQSLEQWAPPVLQESYDNAGLITGPANLECTGVLISLDATEAVIEEARNKKCNLVVSHHPILFRGLKSLTGKTYVERAIILAIKYDIALYAIHTNLDNLLYGVNDRMADRLGLRNRKLLDSKAGYLDKLAVYVPLENRDALMNALFEAGAGHIGHYKECSFSMQGEGTFFPTDLANPVSGKKNERARVDEYRMEFIMPSWKRNQVVEAMKAAHPYEEVAYEIVKLENSFQETGSGVIGELPEPMPWPDFLQLLSRAFQTPMVRYSGSGEKSIQKVALCGGAGSFLIPKALQAGADVYVTADLKYHEFFDAGEGILLADIGHYESEQYTIDLLMEQIRNNFPTFAVLKTELNTNPVQYFTGKQV